jgi:hypothetical protein
MIAHPIVDEMALLRVSHMGRSDGTLSRVVDALATANENILGALAALDRRFESVNEFSAQLADARAVFARKTDIDAILAAMEKSQLKAERAIEDRFHSVNEFRVQLGAQQGGHTLAYGSAESGFRPFDCACSFISTRLASRPSWRHVARDQREGCDDQGSGTR